MFKCCTEIPLLPTVKENAEMFLFIWNTIKIYLDTSNLTRFFIDDFSTAHFKLKRDAKNNGNFRFSERLKFGDIFCIKLIPIIFQIPLIQYFEKSSKRLFRENAVKLPILFLRIFDPKGRIMLWTVIYNFFSKLFLHFEKIDIPRLPQLQQHKGG